MRALMLPPLVIAAAVLTALFVIYLAIPATGPERATRAARIACLAGGFALAASAGWTVWTLVGR